MVVTGKDTADNMQLIFGPNWQRDEGEAFEEARLDVLLSPPRGSPSYAMTARQGFDIGAPAWSPRPASEAE